MAAASAACISASLATHLRRSAPISPPLSPAPPPLRRPPEPATVSPSPARPRATPRRCMRPLPLAAVGDAGCRRLRPPSPRHLAGIQALPCRRQALIISHWPQTSLPRDANSVKRFENLQSLIRAIRNARAEYSVEPAKRISASVVANTDVLAYISSEKQVLAQLSRLDLQNVHFRESPPDYAKQSIHLVAGEGLEAYLPLVDMVDISLEVQRLAKRLSKMQSEYDALASRLNSPSCMDLALLL